MALTPSRMLPLGTPATDFSLVETVSGTARSYASLRGTRGSLLMFICNHCPYVQHVNPELIALARDYAGRGFAFVAISSNDAVRYPQDGPEAMRENAHRLGYPFPYLYDETQEIARRYGAECTPDFFLFDAQDRLVYRGRLDDSTPGNGRPLTGADLRHALDALLSGGLPDAGQKPSMGCNIKWKGG
jgi:thiol-disulfide isomerase/thioredoxin